MCLVLIASIMFLREQTKESARPLKTHKVQTHEEEKQTLFDEKKGNVRITKETEVDVRNTSLKTTR